MQNTYSASLEFLEEWVPEFRFDKKDVVRGLAGALSCLAFLTFLGLYWLRVSESTNFAIVLFALLAVGALSSFAFYSRYLEAPNRTINVFPVVLLVFSLLFTVAIPPMASPDEGHHFFSSYWLSDAVLGQASFANSENFPVRSDVMELYEESSTEISGQSYRTVLNGFELLQRTSESVEGLSFGFTLRSQIQKGVCTWYPFCATPGDGRISAVLYGQDFLCSLLCCMLHDVCSPDSCCQGRVCGGLASSDDASACCVVFLR